MSDTRIPTTLLTVRQFSDRYPFVTQDALRYLIYRSVPRVVKGRRLPANGFAAAIHRLNRRILIDPDRFLALVASTDGNGRIESRQ
jgi:hypothetical protein